MKKLLLTLLSVGLFGVCFAQNVGIGTNTPDNTALLDLTSDSLGFLAPRLTNVQRDAITNPAHGLTIFNVEDSTIQYWNGECWLRSYQTGCNDCLIKMTLSDDRDTIDRVTSDSVLVTINITQLNGLPTQMPLTVANALPQGMTFTFSQNPLNGPGSSVLTVHASPIVPSGWYPIIIQSFCGSFVQTLVYNVYVEPCYILHVDNSVLNYDMGVDLYNTYPSAPTNTPICVLTVVGTGVEISSNNTAQPAFTTGTSIPAGSLVAIVNNGNILGKGGNGGTAYNPAQGQNGSGFNGGNAINLTLPCTIQNNFNIYGGGGGGNAMAFGYTYSVPVIGNLGLLVGAGGGGGAGGPLAGGVGGTGGNTGGGGIGIFQYSPGFNGTAGQFATGGNGGILNYPIPYSLGILTVNLNPNAFGGKGGEYGFPGTQGAFQLSGNIQVVITVFGIALPPITVFNGTFPIPVPPPPAGLAGLAIKRNGNSCNIPDNNYTTSNLKGRVAP